MAADASAQLKVISNGFVGLNTPTPARRFHVTQGNGANLPSTSGSTVAIFHKSANAGGNSFMSFIGNSGGTTGFNFGDEADENAGFIAYRHSSNQFEIRTNASGVAHVLDSNGNTGLGTASPGARLHVAGDIIYSGGTLSSDRRLKKNIESYNRGLETILSLNPVSYEYNGKAGISTTSKQIGIIAQELQKVEPELVTTFSHSEILDEEGTIKNHGEFLGIQDGAIKWLLVNAVKEQQAMIDVQAEKIAQLEESIANIGTATDNSSNNTNVTLNGYDLAELDQNRPNPFSNSTTIDYIIPTEAQNAEINIFGQSGQLLKTVTLQHVGKGTITLDAEDLPSGTYSYQLVVDGRGVETNNMILNK